MTGLRHQEGVLADGRIIRGRRHGELGIGQLAETLQSPEGKDAGFGLTLTKREVRHEGHGRQAGCWIAIHQHAECIETDDLARMAKRCDEASGIGLRKVGVTENGGALVLNAVDAPEVMLAVRAHRGAGLRVLRAARVVVGHDRGVEIEDVHRAIRTERDADGAEPMVRGAEPLRVRQRQLTFVSRAVEEEFLLVDDIQDGLGDEDHAVVFLRPSTVFINLGGASGRVVADLVDLQ